MMFASLGLSAFYHYKTHTPEDTVHKRFKDSVLKNVEEPSTQIKEDYEQLKQRAGVLSPSYVLINHGYGANNAFAYYGDTHIGGPLVAMLERKQINFIMAHELDHIRNNDAKKTSLFFLPIAYGALCTAYSIFLFLKTGYDLEFASQAEIQPLAQELLQAACTLPLTCLSILVTFCAKYASGRAAEFRCDSNAVLTTGDSKSAARALRAISPTTKTDIYWEDRITQTHPALRNRVHNIMSTKLDACEHFPGL
ncbi:MAG: M48 family metalloprotease [Alphaproteobacteria bacterium]|nr:M48 family metalloprotease [Alphaproteobacteria bacterium]